MTPEHYKALLKVLRKTQCLATFIANGNEGFTLNKVTYAGYEVKSMDRHLQGINTVNDILEEIIGAAMEEQDTIKALRHSINKLPCYVGQPYGVTYECDVNKPCPACALRHKWKIEEEE